MKTNSSLNCLLITLSLAGVFGCATKVETNEPEPQPYQSPTADNSQNSLDWSGTYRGVLPCADCKGIETALVLTEDLNFRVERTYLGKSEEVFKEQGDFEWDTSGGRIHLLINDEDKALNHYLVGENQLIKLDINGKRIEGKLADMYALKKEP